MASPARRSAPRSGAARVEPFCLLPRPMTGGKYLPCKTFAAAIAVTNAGGEINCADSGGFGTLTITKAITVACEVGTAGILGLGGGSSIAIDINAATTDVVTLRGLDIDGQATSGY